MLLFSSPAWSNDLVITDDLDQQVRLRAPAQRIIALYGAYNEILAAMGLEDRLVGRTKADTEPASILSKPSIGTHMRPNVEIILGLKPDLVIQDAGRREAQTGIQQLQSRGLPVAVFHPNTFAQLFTAIERLGVLTGEPGRAQDLVTSLKGRLEAVEKRLQGITSRPAVFFEVRYPNLLGAGKASLVDDIIRYAGGINCLKHSKKMVRLNMEALIDANPDYYIVQRGPMNQNPGPPATRSHFGVLQAVRKGQVLEVEEQVFSRPSPRAVEAVEQLARFLHPEAYGN
jgi:iron complex transport system substrate-binding protein